MNLSTNNLNTSSIVLILLLVFQGFTGCIQVPHTTQFDSELPKSDINGVRYHVETFGHRKNPTVIIVHGGPGADYRYLLGLKALADKFFVIFYDQHGSGLSPRSDDATYSMNFFVNELNQFVDHYSAGKKAILVGHSWGAMIASAYLSQHGEKISHAVLAEPGLLNQESAVAMMEKLNSSQSIWQKLKIVPLILKYPFVKSEDGHEGMDYVATKMMGASEGPPYQCPGEMIAEGFFTRAGYKVMKNTVFPIFENPQIFKDDYTSGIKKYSGHILLLSSSCSFIGYDFQEKFHRSILPSQTIHVKIENTGHNMFNFKLDESLSILNQFLLTQSLL